MYHDFLVLREHYWARLDPLQQAQAIERGQQVYADYGDRVAKPPWTGLRRLPPPDPPRLPSGNQLLLRLLLLLWPL
ncbi:hypothetical protein M3581_22710, partial [Stenotrophomonas maltophilia]|nr:hypothetical protein [Stenotrophomonas maltophilia]